MTIWNALGLRWGAAGSQRAGADPESDADEGQGRDPKRLFLVIGLGALSWVFNYIRRSVSARAVGDVVLKLREDAFDAVMKRDLSFYDTFASGKIVSRVNSDTQAFSQVVTLANDLLSQLLLVGLLIC